MDASLPELANNTGGTARALVRAGVLACERAATRAPLRFALLAVLALLAISVAAFRVSYETNDDVFLTMIVAGKGFCTAPDEHLIFSNILVGHALKRLYLAFPGVPWYGCYLLLTHYLAQVAVLYGTLVAEPHAQGPDDSRRRSAGRRLAAYLVYFAVVELVLLNNLQFTSTAFLAAQGGILLGWLAATAPAHWRTARRLVLLSAAAALVVLAGLIRLESLCLALLVAAPLGLLMWRRVARGALVPGALAAAAAAVLVLTARGYNQAAYENDPAWKGFYAYNALRCRFNDYGWTSHTPQTAHVFEAVGWSKNDHDMIARWFFDDPERYSEAKLSAALAAYPWKTARLTGDYLWQAVRRPLRDRSVWAVALVMPFFLAGIGGPRDARRAILACAVVAVALVVLVSVNNKVPPLRMYFPMLAFPLSMALLFADSGALVTERQKSSVGLRAALDAWRAQPRLAQVVVVLLVVGTSMGVYRQARRSVRVERERAALTAFLAEARVESRNLYVCWEAALPFELVSPLDGLDSWSGVSVLNLTWTQRTPWQDDLKRRFGISCLARAMFERDDVVLVATSAHRALFAQFVKEHYRADVEFAGPRQFGTKFAAGRFHRRGESPAIAAQRSGGAAR
jgi:hypothetical protein